MKKLCIYGTLLLGSWAMPADAAGIFQTIDDLKPLLTRYAENPAIGNFDYLNPDFSYVYSSLEPTSWETFLMKVGLKKKMFWEPSAFLELMGKVTEQRKKEGFKGQVIQRHEVSQDDHFLIWGSLHGALHSLIITLEHLKEQKIIDNNFKIIAPKYYLIFDGNVVDRSPYSLETLTIVLRLMEVNPTRVFYIRGNHEHEGFWEEYDMHDEQTAKLGKRMGLNPPYPDNVTPHTAELYAFFDTLPMVLYLAANTAEHCDGLRIAHFKRKEFHLTLEEQKYVLNSFNTRVFNFPLSLPAERGAEKSATVKAIIEGDSELVPDYTADGLRIMRPDQGVTAWSVLSAPTLVYQKMYDFFTDSYVEITISLPIEKTTITQHYQDIRSRSGFKTGRVYNIFSSQSDEQFRAHPTINILKIGGTIDLEGPNQVLGTQIEQGLALAINKQNQEGIIQGHLLGMTLLNDDHSPIKARRNIELLMGEYDTKIMIATEESMMVTAYMDLFLKKDFMVFFPFSGVARLRSSEYSNVVHYGPSYIEEAEAVITYILDKIGANKIAVLYEQTSVGTDALVGLKLACKEKGFTSFVEIPFASNILEFKDQIKEIGRENPDVIALFLTAASAQEFIRQIGVQKMGEKILCGTSSIGALSFRQYYKEKGLRVVATHLAPNPVNSHLAIAEDFRKEAATQNIPLSPQSLEAYIIGSIFVEGLRLIKGPITPETIMKSFEAIHDYPFKGLMLNFNKDRRRLSNTIWLDDGETENWTAHEVHTHPKEEIEALHKTSLLEKRLADKKVTEQKKSSWW